MGDIKKNHGSSLILMVFTQWKNDKIFNNSERKDDFKCKLSVLKQVCLDRVEQQKEV